MQTWGGSAHDAFIAIQAANLTIISGREESHWLLSPDLSEAEGLLSEAVKRYSEGQFLDAISLADQVPPSAERSSEDFGSWSLMVDILVVAFVSIMSVVLIAWWLTRD